MDHQRCFSTGMAQPDAVGGASDRVRYLLRVTCALILVSIPSPGASRAVVGPRPTSSTSITISVSIAAKYQLVETRDPEIAKSPGLFSSRQFCVATNLVEMSLPIFMLSRPTSGSVEALALGFGSEWLDHVGAVRIPLCPRVSGDAQVLPLVPHGASNPQAVLVRPE